VTTASKILTTAAEIVGGARSQTHGPKERSFQHIANLWNAYLKSAHSEPKDCPIPGMCGWEAQISAVDVAWMMTLLKVVRSVQGTPVEDHYVDAAGYAGIAGEIQLSQAKPETKPPSPRQCSHTGCNLVTPHWHEGDKVYFGHWGLSSGVER